MLSDAVLVRLLAFCALFLAAPGAAQTVRPETAATSASTAIVPRYSPSLFWRAVVPIARYGPFFVIEPQTAELAGSTDQRSPSAFRAMLRDYPQIKTLVFVECPGTYDDHANLELGRMIRAAGVAAYVPAGGSVRSGAVELMLAGTSVTIDDGALFAVHAWRERNGRDAAQFPADSWEHRKYLAYYREMGMSPGRAKAFYAMTNSAPHAHPLWMWGSAMRQWIGGRAGQPQSPPQLGRLDLGAPLN